MRPRRQRRHHQRHLQQRLVAAADAHGDGLGLVLDGVDRSGQLLDGRGEAGGEVVEHHARRADLAELGLVGVEPADAERVAEQRRHPHGGGGLEVAVVGARRAGRRGTAGIGVDSSGRSRRSRPSPSTGAVGSRRVATTLVDGGARLPQRPGLGVDGQRRLVAEQVPDHRGEHEGEVRVGVGHGQDVRAPRSKARSPSEAITIGAALWARKIADLLGHVVGGGADEAGGAHEDQRLRTTGRCASCPRWRRRRSTCSRAPTA